MARDYDLLLSLFPFEKKWFAARAPGLPVEFVGHPIFDNYLDCHRAERRVALGFPQEIPLQAGCKPALQLPGPAPGRDSRPPVILLLPGSRRSELQRHVPVMREAAGLIAARQPAQFKMIVPDEARAGIARALLPAGQPGLTCKPVAWPGRFPPPRWPSQDRHHHAGMRLFRRAGGGDLQDGLAHLSLRAATGQCEIPLHAQSAGWRTDLPGIDSRPRHRRNIAAAALELLANPARRDDIRAKLDAVMQSLGGPGAARRAAAAILRLTDWQVKRSITL